MNKNQRVHGLILAAGLSGRMKKFKPLLLYDNKPFIVNIIQKISSICNPVVVVTGHNSEKLILETKKHLSENILKNIKFVFNRNYKNGMFTSLQTGFQNIGDCDWVLYHFVDQPAIPINFYREFTAQINNNYNWIQPEYKRQNGHPILIGKQAVNIILNSPIDSNLRKISRQKNILKKIWECDYPEILEDIDTLEHYKQMMKRR